MITGKIIAKDLLLLVSCTYYPTDKNINKEKGQKRKIKLGQKTNLVLS